MYRVTKLLMPRQRVSYFRRFNVTHDEERSLLTIEDMPHPMELPIFGTKLALFAAGSGTKLHEYVDSRHKQLGPIFYEKLVGSTKLVFVSDARLMRTLFMNLDGKYPKHILPEPWILYEKLYGSKRGLFFMDDQEWLTNRKVMNKHVLREDSEKWMTVPIEHTVKNFIENWKISSEGCTFVPNLESDLYRLSTDIIINLLLDSESMKKSPHYEELLNRLSESVKKIFETTSKLYGLPVVWYQRLNLKPWTDFVDSVDRSLYFSQKLVQEMLKCKEIKGGLVHKLFNEDMPEETIVRIVADFIIAAGDTTAYTTLWILYLLGNNDIEKNEIFSKGKTYIRFVIKEAMRLYPVAPFLTRIIPKESVIGGYKLNAGTPIIASLYTSGRDDNNFSQANQFAPYRWDRINPRKIQFENHVTSASLPFALGSRSCVGKKIAMLQLTEFVHQIINNFEFTCENAHSVNAITSMVLIPNQSIKIKLSPRKTDCRNL